MKAARMTARQIMTSISADDILDAYLAEWGGARRETACLIAQLRTALIIGVPVVTGASISIERTAWKAPDGFRNTVDVADHNGQPCASLAFTLSELGAMPVTDNTGSALSNAQIAAALGYEMGFHGPPDARENFALDLSDVAKRA